MQEFGKLLEELRYCSVGTTPAAAVRTVMRIRWHTAMGVVSSPDTDPTVLLSALGDVAAAGDDDPGQQSHRKEPGNRFTSGARRRRLGEKSVHEKLLERGDIATPLNYAAFEYLSNGNQKLTCYVLKGYGHNQRFSQFPAGTPVSFRGYHQVHTFLLLGAPQLHRVGILTMVVKYKDREVGF